MSSSDQAILQRYVRTGSQSAFDELVRRHGGLVHASILRRVRNRALAEDATQGVFFALSRKAHTLTDHPGLAGWLLKSARFAAADTVRNETRRARHERAAGGIRPEAVNANFDNEEDARLQALDEAIVSLTTLDRESLLLRYYQDEPFAKIAIALGTSEEGARKRVDRALVKLRKLLLRSGMRISAVAMAGMIGTWSRCGAASGFRQVIVSGSSTQAQLTGVDVARRVLGAWTRAKLKLLAAASTASFGIALAMLTGFVWAHQIPEQVSHPRDAPPQTQGLVVAPPAHLNSTESATVDEAKHHINAASDSLRLDLAAKPELFVALLNLKSTPDEGGDETSNVPDRTYIILGIANPFAGRRPVALSNQDAPQDFRLTIGGTASLFNGLDSAQDQVLSIRLFASAAPEILQAGPSQTSADPGNPPTILVSAPLADEPVHEDPFPPSMTRPRVTILAVINFPRFLSF